MIQEHPPTTALPDDVLALMRRVVEPVDLLYWVPAPTKGSKGYTILADRALLKRKNPERAEDLPNRSTLRQRLMKRMRLADSK